MSLLKKINALEPLWWSLFGLGGMIAAFFLPVHIFLHGIAIPLGWVSQDLLSYDRMSMVFGSPYGIIVKLFLFSLISFPLFHAAHRIRLTIEDLRVGWLNCIMPFICYGGAIVLSVVAIVVLFVRIS